MAARCRRAPAACLLIVGLVVAPATRVDAQRALLSVFGLDGPPSSAFVDLPSLRRTPFSSELLDDALFLADGTLLLRKVHGEAAWRVRDLRGTLEVVLPAATHTGAGFTDGFVSHPRRPVLFGRHVDGQTYMARVDASGVHVFRHCALRTALGGFELSVDGHHAVILCGVPPPSPLWQLVVVDTATGTEVRRVDLGNGMPSPFALNVEGAEVLTVRTYFDLGGIRYALERIDTTTGAVLQSATVPNGGAVVANPRRPTLPLLLACDLTACRVRTINALTLALGDDVLLPRLVEQLSFSADGAQVLVSALRSAAILIDLATGAVLQEAPAPPAGVVMATWGAEPQPPGLLPPLVAGRTVTLSWSLPAVSTAATGYRLEAGSGPGLIDILTTAVGPTPSFTAAGVPSGRYHVRVRALNGNGVSAPSNEVVVTVP